MKAKVLKNKQAIFLLNINDLSKSVNKNQGGQLRKR